MRFLVLLKKELRECLPWVLLAAAFVLVFGFFSMINQRIDEYSYKVFTPGSSIPFSYFEFIGSAPCDTVGVFVFLASIGLGLALGIRQFWMAHFTRTWGFTLHRSASRAAILWAKLAAAAVSITFSLGLVWFYFYWYARRSEYSPLPPTIRVFIEGWIFIVFGLVVYLGTALSGLSRARWYTTKMLGLAFSVLIYVTILAEVKLTLAFLAVVVGVVILLSQIIDTFLSREF
jgi:hypothetical protein